MWDERYSGQAYAYGKEPNSFLREHVEVLPRGRVLCLAEGEGRNAVFLALQGYVVTAVDSSVVGLRKAAALAEERGVSIEIIHADLNHFDPGTGVWDAIVSIFVPLPSEQRVQLHSKVIRALRPGGVYLMEAYRPQQLAYGTGGGDNIDCMQSVTTVAKELEGLDSLHLCEIERDVVEGSYHTGLAAVLQLIARKP